MQTHGRFCGGERNLVLFRANVLHSCIRISSRLAGESDGRQLLKGGSAGRPAFSYLHDSEGQLGSHSVTATLPYWCPSWRTSCHTALAHRVTFVHSCILFSDFYILWCGNYKVTDGGICLPKAKQEEERVGKNEQKKKTRQITKIGSPGRIHSAFSL